MGGIEYGIRIFLIRENVAVLATAHALPSHDRLFRYHTTCAVVPDHTAKHPVVRSRNVVVLINGKRRQGRCIDTEDLCAVNSWNHCGIQSMNTFHDQNVFLVQLHHVAIEISLSVFEIKSWDLHLLAIEKLVQLFAEENHTLH